MKYTLERLHDATAFIHNSSIESGQDSTPLQHFHMKPTVRNEFLILDTYTSMAYRVHCKQLLDDMFDLLGWMFVKTAERVGTGIILDSDTTESTSNEPIVHLNTIRPHTNDDQTLPTALE